MSEDVCLSRDCLSTVIPIHGHGTLAYVPRATGTLPHVYGMLPHGHHALTASDAENGNGRAQMPTL